MLLLLIQLDCKKKDWREEIQNIDYKEIHKESIANKNLPISVEGGFNDREEVVKRWIKAKKENPKSSDDFYLLTETEYKLYFLPHTLGSGTSLDVTPLESYWPMFLDRRAFGLEKVLSTIARSTGKVKKFNWRPEIRSYGPWKAWKLDSLLIESKKGSEDIAIEEIKLVACFENQCKIAVIAP